MDIDRAAIKLMNFRPGHVAGVLKQGQYEAFYHGQKVYSVRDTVTDMITLVVADYPGQAIAKVAGSRTVVNQNGTNNHCITNVGTLNIN